MVVGRHILQGMKSLTTSLELALNYDFSGSSAGKRSQHSFFNPKLLEILVVANHSYVKVPFHG